MKVDEYKVNCELFHNKVDIATALKSVAGQENCDDEEYDLMVEAAEYIKFMRKENEKLTSIISDDLKSSYNNLMSFFIDESRARLKTRDRLAKLSGVIGIPISKT